MRRFSLVGSILVFLTLLVGISWLGVGLIGRSFLDKGEHRYEVEGLSAEAIITRDQYGIPYIDAATEEDACAALGYAHAQDRLWQMDLMRRAGEGRLAEIFGRNVVSYDALLRTVGFKRVASEILKKMPKRARTSLDAYCRGVNAYIAENHGSYAMEFDALGYEPEEWRPEHSILISRLLAWELNTSFWTDVVFGDIKARVDSGKFAEILPYYPSDAPTLIPGGQRPEPLLEQLNAPPPPPVDTTQRDSTLQGDSTAPVPPVPPAGRPAAPGGRPSASAARPGSTPDLADLIVMERSMRRFLGIDGAHIGSNGWAIAGERTEGKRPILANDPHLPHTAPSRWYQVVMTYKGRRIGGVTIAGMPYVVIGRSNNIAWGLTSLMADETDFYIERLDSAKRNLMEKDGAWEKLTVIRDTIQVKDSSSVPLTIRIGRHGPFISDLHPFASRPGNKGNGLKPDPRSLLLASSPVAMRWRGNDVSQEIAALQGINNADNLQEFTAAARLGGVPSLCFIYADQSGTIATVPVARVPQREGTLANVPNPGWESRYDWQGMVAMDKLPTLINPERGYVASANNKVSNSLGFYISDLWEDPSRAIRMEEMLKEGDNFAATDFVQMQGDLVSPHMEYMTGFLLRAFPDSVRQGTAVRAALGRLRTWDGGMLTDAPEAAIAAQWVQNVIEMTYKDEMGPALYANYVHSALLPIRAIRYHVMTGSRWFDNVSTLNKVEVRDEILRTALGRALDSLHKRFGTWDIGTWRYGAMHTLTFPHPFAQNEGLRNIVNIGPYELGGSNTTLNNGEWDLNEPFKVRVGPSMRQIVDFADTSTFLRSVITTGASGQPLNQFYKNQTVLWMSNGYLVLAPRTPQGTAVTSVTTLRPQERSE